MDTLKQLIGQRWTESSSHYDNCPGHGILSGIEKQEWIEVLKTALNTQHSLKILDVGTGTGVIALLLAEMGHDVTGIDLSEGMLQHAKDKAALQHLDIQFLIGDAENPQFPDNTFDVVISRHVVWTLPNPEKAIKEWKRVLKPSGQLLIIDGDWRKLETNIFHNIWRLLAMPLIMITEKRDPRWKGKDLHPYLPMRQRQRPQADIKMLEKENFKTSVTDIKVPHRYSTFEYLKYGYSKDNYCQFVIKAVNTY
nr:class I SAM-dependent methyltransferase [Dehalococcoides mccartyi]